VTGRIALVLLCALACLAAGCASVKPWQREELSRRTMVGDQAAGEQRFDDHSRAAREGAIGGGGEAGGGCGCN
jgi:heat shock protein HslJ